MPKGAIRICISKKSRQHNGQKKKYKRTNNYLQNIHRKTKNCVSGTPLKTGGERRCSARVSSSCSTSDTRHVNRRILTYFTPSRPYINIHIIIFYEEKVSDNQQFHQYQQNKKQPPAVPLTSNN